MPVRPARPVQPRLPVLKPTVYARVTRRSATRRIIFSVKACLVRSRRISTWRSPQRAPQRQQVQRLPVATPHRAQRDLRPRPAKGGPAPPRAKGAPSATGAGRGSRRVGRHWPYACDRYESQPRAFRLERRSWCDRYEGRDAFRVGRDRRFARDWRARNRRETRSHIPLGREGRSQPDRHAGPRARYWSNWSHRRPAQLMDYSSGPVLLSNQRESQISRFRAWIVLAIPLAAILFQLFVPRFFEFLGFIEMPLLVVIYFALVRRSQIAGLLTGALVGLAQDSLNKTPVGMLGIVNTLVGYFAASVGLKIDVDHAGVRLPLTFFFYCFHQVLYWVMVRALLNRPMVFDWQRTAIIALLNAIIGVSLFHFLDKLRERP